MNASKRASKYVAALKTENERPILFNGAMVRALLDGTKTQTRRVAKIHLCGRHRVPGPAFTRVTPQGGEWLFHADASFASGEDPYRARCPYGQPGDRLWVRETWGLSREASKVSEWIRYAAGGPPTPLRKVAPAGYSFVDDGRRTWRPSIHMPRWASRLTLEVTEVRVQRLCEISEEDARAEGVFSGNDLDRTVYTDTMDDVTTVDAFRVLWESINGAGSWSANPWVWAISFRRLP